MGKPSTTNPMRERVRCLTESVSRITTLCMALFVAAFIVAFAGIAARAQTQAITLPLVLPGPIVFDAQGDLYFAETNGNVVREFSTAGVITNVAGTGTQGFAGDGGPATSAELDSPAGLAMDSAGNLYIADSHNQRVREVSAVTGVISTIVGTGIAGFSGDGGPAKAAQLDLPTALALDAAGNLFVADTNNHRVRRVAAASGVITTVAGDGVQSFGGDGGPATAASIDSPNGLAVDTVGNLYLADTRNGRVREVDTATGVISTVAGTAATGGNLQQFGGDGGAATAAGLALPRGVTIDAAGNLYLADSANQRVRRISGGVVTTVAGQGTQAYTGDGAPAVSASLDTPRSLAMPPSGLLTIADAGNMRVRQLDALPAPGPDIHTIASQVAAPLASDFTLTATGATSQTIAAGTAATYTFSVGAVGAALASPIALSAQGMPLGSIASFSPVSIPPGGAVTSFTLTVQTPMARLQTPPLSSTAEAIALAGFLLPVVGIVKRRRPDRRSAGTSLILFASSALLFAGCGDRVNADYQGVNQETYTLTVTGTATGPTGNALVHSANVTLVVL